MPRYFPQNSWLAGVAIGLITAACSVAWNMTFSPRHGMGHWDPLSFVAALFTILSAAWQWTREGHNVAEIEKRLVSAGLAGAFIFSMSLLTFAWCWFAAELMRRVGLRQSILRFAVIDFVAMFVLVLTIGYTASRVFLMPTVQRAHKGSS